MAKTVNIIFVVLAVSQIVFCDDADTTTSTEATATTPTPFSCSKPGTFCKNCTILVNCIEGEEGLQEFEIASCDKNKGEFCYRDRECNTVFNPKCMGDDYKFQCTAQGMFPDPANCAEYHICVHKCDTPTSCPVFNLEDKVEWENHVVACKPGYGYNMVTTYCDIKLSNNGTCPDAPPVPLCTKLGQSGALQNKSIWYICKRSDNGALYPELELCATGKWYDGKQCVEHR